MTSSTNDSNSSNSKPTFMKVLTNQTCYPYSQESFAAYLERNKSLENLEFWLAVRHYKFYCFNFFSRSSRAIDDAEFETSLENLSDTVSLSNKFVFNFNSSQEQNLPLSEATHFSILKEKLYAILKTFVLAGSEKEINIPQKARTLMLRQVTVQNHFHPAVLKPARDMIFNLMRESAYTAWVREASNPGIYPTVRSHRRHGSVQSGDSGVSSMEDDEDDNRSMRSTRLLETPLTKGVIRIKRSLSPIARGIKEFAVHHHQRKSEHAPKVAVAEIPFMRSVSYT